MTRDYLKAIKETLERKMDQQIGMRDGEIQTYALIVIAEALIKQNV